MECGCAACSSRSAARASCTASSEEIGCDFQRADCPPVTSGGHSAGTLAAAILPAWRLSQSDLPSKIEPGASLSKSIDHVHHSSHRLRVAPMMEWYDVPALARRGTPVVIDPWGEPVAATAWDEAVLQRLR